MSDKHPVIEAPATVLAPAESSMDTKENKASKTTVEEDLKSAGQRQINLVWENTQMRIALSVIWVSMGVSAAVAVAGKFLGVPDLQLASIVFLYGVANLVTGFYFGRTNHARMGDAPPNKA